jgi:activator of HSP90 ATPase
LFSAKCKITEVHKCEGEAVANNRKGKLIFFYEWDIVLNWTGRLKGGEQEAEGTVNIPNLSEENDITEVDVSLHLFVIFTECSSEFCNIVFRLVFKITVFRRHDILWYMNTVVLESPAAAIVRI